MKFYKAVAFFGHYPVKSLCIKSEKCMSGLRSSLEFYFLKTPWSFLISPMGRKQSLFIDEYDNMEDIAACLQECIKVTCGEPILESQHRSTFDLAQSINTSLNMDSLRNLLCVE